MDILSSGAMLLVLIARSYFSPIRHQFLRFTGNHILTYVIIIGRSIIRSSWGPGSERSTVTGNFLGFYVFRLIHTSRPLNDLVP